MPQPGTGATHYYAKIGTQEKGHAIKGLVVCNGWDVKVNDLEPTIKILT